MRVLIADDNKEIRSALTLVLREMWPNCEIAEVGQAADAVTRLDNWSPELVLLDWHLEGGPTVTRSIRKRYPACAVVAMSSLPEERDEALRSGATAFIATNDPPDVLINLLARLGNHERLADPTV